MPEALEWLGDVTVRTIVMVLAAIAAIYFAIKKGWRWLKRFVKLVDQLASLPAFMAETEKTLGEIKHEVFPNKGGSLRDRVDGIGEAITSIEEKLENDNDRLLYLEQKVDENDCE